jgi:hypothetical protein
VGPFGDGKTSVRGGVGIFDVLAMIYQFELQADLHHSFFPSIPHQQAAGGDVFSGNVPIASDACFARDLFQQGPSCNYVGQWNFNGGDSNEKAVT